MMPTNSFPAHNSYPGYAEAAVNAAYHHHQLAAHHAQMIPTNASLSHHQPPSVSQSHLTHPPAPVNGGGGQRQGHPLPATPAQQNQGVPNSANANVSLNPHPGAALPPIHLASITSLTQLLSELPLPSAMAEGGGGQALIQHPQTALYARQLLTTPDPNMVLNLTNALARSDTSIIALKEEYNRTPDQVPDPNVLCELARAILVQNPQVFTPVSSAASSTMTNSHNNQDLSPSAHTPGSARDVLPSSPTPAQPAHDGVATGDYQPKVAKVLLDRMEVGSGGSPETPLTPSGGESKAQSDSLRKKIVSVGKQPKAQSRKKKTMVSELFDSLTPDAKYFADTTRRRRTQPKTYNEHDFERPPLSELAGQTPDEIAGMGRVTPEDAGSGYESASKPGTSIKKGRKRQREDSESSFRADELDRPLTPTEMIKERDKQWQVMAEKRRAKRNRRRLLKQYIEDPDELLENETFRTFCQLIDEVFENCEEYDMAGGDEDDAIPSECLIAKGTLISLCLEADKMKTMGVTSRVQVDRLVKLMTILEKNVRDAIQLIMSFDNEKEGDEEDVAYQELVSERIFRSAEAALTALTIMTSTCMPKQVYIEDTIERSIQLVKNQLINVIYPAYDPTYRMDKKKDSGGAGMSKGRKKQAAMRNKTVKSLYGKLVELLGCFSELVEIQPLTDTCVVQLTSLAVTPFFVEGIPELQLTSLRLGTVIFKRYSKHRDVILQEILGSLHRLPQGKGSRHTYRLNSEEYIQMITALIMHLVQCVVEVPTSRRLSRLEEDLEEDYDPSILPRHHKKKQSQPGLQEADDTVQNSYHAAKQVANKFLSGFLSKCTAKSEDDYRRLFDGFLQDLLTAVHRPEWPAAEVMLGLLGALLVSHFRNHKLDNTLRVASLDYLGTVAAKLRKDAVSSQLDEATLNEIVTHLSEEEDDDHLINGNNSKRNRVMEEPTEDRMQILQRALVDYLLFLRDGVDPSIEFARQFYIAQWYNQRTDEMRRIMGKGKGGPSDSRTATELEECERAIEQTAASKQFLLTLVDREDEIEAAAAGGFGSDDSPMTEDHATFIVKYLSAKRKFGQSFEHYLHHILCVLNEKQTQVGLRTKAMKCLALVVEADPSVLARPEVKKNVQSKLLDQAGSVREAAIDLLGKFIMQRPELIDQYYQMLLQRILDTGVSVRKRVIKIMKEICEKRPDFERIPEIMTAMIRRVNDEEGIKKLVNDAFHSLWFQACRERDTATLLKKVVTITDVVGNSKGATGEGLDWLSTLLENLFKAQDKSAINASKQIVDCLVEHVLTLDAKPEDGKSHGRLLDCMVTLYLFSRVKPELMIKHAETLEPYLRVRSSSEADIVIQVVQILQMVVPKMDHPSEKFLNNLEESMLSMIKQGSMKLIQDCLSCISSVSRKQRRKIKRVADHFHIYFNILVKTKEDIETDVEVNLERKKAAVARSLFIVGVMCKYFDFDAEYPEGKRPSPSWTERVFDLLIFFAKEPTEIIKAKAVGALGHFCSEHNEYLMKEDLKRIYHDTLNSQRTDKRQKNQQVFVLNNIQLFLREFQRKEVNAEEERKEEMKKHGKEKQDALSGTKGVCGGESGGGGREEKLHEMGERDSGMASQVIQVYLREVQNCYMFCGDDDVRRAASEVTVLTLSNGLVTPGIWIPSLVAMSTDPDPEIRTRASGEIKRIHSDYQGFVLSKAAQGIQMAFRLQKRLNHANNQRLLAGGGGPEPVRGVRIPSQADKQKYAAHALGGPGTEGVAPAAEAHLAYLYSLLREKKQSRRSFLNIILKKFEEEQKTPLEELLFLADNLAHFPYLNTDEPLYVMHHVDRIIAFSGPAILQTFKDHLLPKYNMMGVEGQGAAAPVFEDDDDDNAEQLFIRLPSKLEPLYECINGSLGCFLLLYLKLFLKGLYGINDMKIQEYLPNETGKTYEKSVNRKSVGGLWVNGVKLFDDYGRIFPESVLYDLLPHNRQQRHTQDGKLRLCQQYISFKQMMMSLDAAQASDDDENTNDGMNNPSGAHNPPPSSPVPEIVAVMEG